MDRLAGNRSTSLARDRAQAVAEAMAGLDQVADLRLDQRTADAAHQLLDVVLARLPGVPRQVGDQLRGAHEAADHLGLVVLAGHALDHHRHELELRGGELDLLCLLYTSPSP